MNPFHNIESAFDVFFTEGVIVKLRDGSTHTIQACVMADNTGDVITDTAVDTNREDISILAKKCDWEWVSSKISVGDNVERLNGKRYAVMNVVEDFALGKIIKARQI